MDGNQNSGHQLSPKSVLIWRIVQVAVWLVGVAIVFFLIFFPAIGIHLFWNILIPVAPALLVLAVGLWRNVCPLATTSLFPRHMKVSQRKKLRIADTGKFNLTAVIALFLLVPLRHAIFDTNGLATALLLISIGVVALFIGIRYEWKSGWCSGLCPVHPVEKLYGVNNSIKLPNAHCDRCHRCVNPCPDSTNGITPLTTTKTSHHRIAGFLMVGAFPGFVWGWFQVPDYAGVTSANQLISIYSYPFLGLVATSLLYIILKGFIQEKNLISIFAASAVSLYYWFRIPALFGFGIFPEDGMLVDLSVSIPEWAIFITISITTIFFFWWIVLRKVERTSWSKRPVFVDR